MYVSLHNSYVKQIRFETRTPTFNVQHVTLVHVHVTVHIHVDVDVDVHVDPRAMCTSIARKNGSSTHYGPTTTHMSISVHHK